MRRILFNVVFGMVFIITSSVFGNVKNSSDISKTFKVDKGGTLSISINSGDITLNSWDKLEVSVNIDGVNSNDNQIKISKSGNTINIIDNSGWGWGESKDVVVSIPSEFNVDVNSRQGDIAFKGNLTGYLKAVTGGGDVDLGNIHGNTDVSTNGGDIRTKNINGDITLSTKGGDIKTGNISGKAKINTMGGDINLGNVGNDATLNTFGGEISLGNIGGNAILKTMGGNIYADKIGGSASVSTNGGNIQLKGVSNNIKARTLGGNLSLKNVKGAAIASTNSGDVDIEFLSIGTDESHISTLNGGITVYLNSSVKATINASVRNYGWWDESESKKYIESDFKAKSFDANKNSNKVTAEYELNGGGPVITLKAMNGKIKIKRLNK